MTAAAIQPNAPRRWLRFSLRMLLVFMLLASIGLGWLGSTLLRVRKQRAIVAQIEAAGGWVFCSHQFPLDGKAQSSLSPLCSPRA
jgi:hypothetical protein